MLQHHVVILITKQSPDFMFSKELYLNLSKFSSISFSEEFISSISSHKRSRNSRGCHPRNSQWRFNHQNFSLKETTLEKIALSKKVFFFYFINFPIRSGHKMLHRHMLHIDILRYVFINGGCLENWTNRNFKITKYKYIFNLQGMLTKINTIRITKI